MFIEQVVVRNFKSFGAEAQTLKLDKNGLTCLVGPNGSGKSTILEAVSFALTEDTKALRVGNPKELLNKGSRQNTMAVSITFKTCANQRHTIEATGHVVGDKCTVKHRVDGKVKSQKEIRQLLKMYGLDLNNPFFIIHQSSIMAFGEKSPVQLADMIAQVSGSKIFMDSKQRGDQELRRYNESAATIERNMQLLFEKSEAARTTAMLQDDIARLKRQIEEYERNSAIQQHNDWTNRIQDLEEMKQQHMHAVTRAQNELAAKTSEWESLQQRCKDMQRQCAGENAANDTNVQDQLDACTKEKLLCDSRLASAKAELHRAQSEQAQLHARVAALKAQITTARMALDSANQRAMAVNAESKRIEEDLAEASEVTSVEATRAGLAQKIRETEGEIKQHKSTLKQVSTEQARLEQALAWSSDAAIRTRAKLLPVDDDVSGATHVDAHSLQAMYDAMDGMQTKVANLERHLRDVQAHMARLHRPTPSTGKATSKATPLHQMFSFRPEAKDQLLGLSVLLGDKLDTVVAADLPAAKTLLATAKKSNSLRIVVADFIRPQPEHVLTKQQQMIGQLPSGAVHRVDDVIVSHHPMAVHVLNKLGGNALLAANDDVGQALAAHGIASVAVTTGNFHGKGYLSGGYRSVSPDVRQKVEHDVLQAQTHELETELQEARQQRDMQQAAIDVAVRQQEKLAQRAELHETLVQQEAAVVQSQLQLDKVMAQAATTEKTLSMLADRLQRYESQLAGLASEDASKHRTCLQRSLDQYRREHEDLQHTIESHEDNIQQLESDLASAEEGLTDLPDSSDSGPLSARIVALEEQAVQLANQQQDWSRAVEAATNQRQARMQDMMQIENDASMAEESVGVCKALLQAAEKNLMAVQTQLDEATNQRKALLHTHPWLRHAPVPSTPSTDMPPLSQLQADLAAKTRSLPKGPTQQHMVKDPAPFLEMKHQIANCMARLNEAAVQAEAVIRKANDITFDSISREFSDIFTGLVPTKQGRLVKLDASDMQQGVAFEIRTVTRSVEGGQWKSSVAELSGGQKTMLALSFLFTLARHQNTGLAIFDEIDAALDEVNAARIAHMLNTLYRDGQALLVSHHPTVHAQAACSVHVAKRGLGTVIEGVSTR